MELTKTIELIYWNDFVKFKILSFWLKRGFKFYFDNDSILKGSRGSLWWNLISFDMSKLKSEITIERKHDNQIICFLNINTAFQAITQWNFAFWKLELLTFESSILNNDNKEEEWKRFNKEYRIADRNWLFYFTKRPNYYYFQSIIDKE